MLGCGTRSLSIARRGRALALAALLVLVAPFGLAEAGSFDPVTLERLPDDAGEIFSPGVRTVEALPRSYVEEEFLVSGTASIYNYASNPPASRDDVVAIEDGVPYTTRMIVRRPANPRRFNGSVVIEWWNSTAGFDTAPAWDASAEYFARTGTIYVGVTNSATAESFLVGGCSVLGTAPRCGDRYAALSFPENGLAWDALSQIAALFKGNAGAGPAPLPKGHRVRRIYHVGQSQQGGSVITYASAFHAENSEINDGYFVQQAARARGLNQGSESYPACGEEGAPAFPQCTAVLAAEDRMVSTDLSVPVMHVVSETDIEVLAFAAFQEDTPTYRYYEVAGAGHLTVHRNVEVLPAGAVGPDPLLLESLCQFELNSTADGPVFFSYFLNAVWANLELQVRRGVAPPAGRAMELEAPLQVARDPETGNGLGGIQLPSLEVPLATYTPGNVADPDLPPLLVFIGNLACRLASSVTPFSEEELASRYPTHRGYVRDVARSAFRLWRERLLLPHEVFQIVREAAASDIGERRPPRGWPHRKHKRRHGRR